MTEKQFLDLAKKIERGLSKADAISLKAAEWLAVIEALTVAAKLERLG